MVVPLTRPAAGNGRPVAVALLLLALAVVAWARLTPLTLPAAPAWAERVAASGGQGYGAGELTRAFLNDHSVYDGEGRRWPFPPAGDDGFYFLRLAERVLEQGTPCAGPGPECRDPLADAPLGRTIERPDSPHLYALALAQQLAAVVEPATPPWIAAAGLALCLSLPAAAALAWLLRGAPGACVGAPLALVAALAAPPVLGRTLGADTDIWMATLPLVAIAFAVGALEAGTRTRAVAAALVAGALLGLLAAVWSGWPLFALVVCAGLALLAVGGAPGQRRRSAGALAALLPGLAALLALFGVPVPWVETAAHLAGMLLPAGGSTPPLPSPWPDTFSEVAELRSLEPVAAFGPVWLAAGIAGPALAALPAGLAAPLRWTPLGLAALLVALAPPAHLLALGGAALFAAAALLHRRREGRAPAPLWLFAALWGAASLLLAGEGARFVYLAAAPLALGLAGVVVAAGEGSRVGRRGSGSRWGAALAALLLAPPVTLRIAEAVHAPLQPPMSAAWYRVLAGLHDSEATVVGWWDRGHRIAYFSGRPTPVDGASLRRPAVHWVGRALANPDPEHAAALLRMLACGRVEEAAGEVLRPYEALVAGGTAPLAAAQLVERLVHRPAPEAAQRLRAAGVASDRAQAVAAALACRAGPLVLVLDSPLLASRGWSLSGFWDPAGGSAPQAVNWSRDWHRCEPEPGGGLACPLGLTGADGWVLDTLRFDPREPEALRITGRPPDTVHTNTFRPALVRMAAPDRLHDFVVTAGTIAEEMAVLVDPAARRVFVGSPGVVRSTLVRLVLLEGRYDRKRFGLRALERVITGERVSAWGVEVDR